VSAKTKPAAIRIEISPIALNPTHQLVLLKNCLGAGLDAGLGRRQRIPIEHNCVIFPAGPEAKYRAVLQPACDFRGRLWAYAKCAGAPQRQVWAL